MLEDTQDREEIIERVAALDIGKAEVVVCVRVPSPTQPGVPPTHTKKTPRRTMTARSQGGVVAVWAGRCGAVRSRHCS